MEYEHALDEEIAKTQKKLIPYVFLQIFAAIPLGLGILGLLGENPASVHPLLGNSLIIYMLLGVGLILFIPVQLKMPSLIRKLNKLREHQKS